MKIEKVENTDDQGDQDDQDDPYKDQQVKIYKKGIENT